nr:diguanylate cyclase [Pseudomarimonas arenosa]
MEEVIHATGETVVASAVTAEGDRVVLKYLDSEHPTPESMARWQHEFSILQSIDSPLVLKALDLRKIERSMVLVLEEFASTNLAQLIERGSLDLSDQLAIAVRLTRAMGDVHEHRLIHGDIAPKNVLIDPSSLALKLCDFGLSTRLDVQSKQSDSSAMVGTLDYMSPEQTGRTNLDIDYRSDFYSLGATLYELFSGRKPFEFDDPMSLLHAQLASMPTPLHELDSSIPEPVSAIVDKLLAKHPDDRYQSSFGLQHDLEACAQVWRLYHRIDRFELGRADVPERFCLAQKLYGRQQECAQVLAAFKRVVNSGNAELLLIGGYSGIGKTALVNELHRPILARRGYLIRGKCDQFGRNQPYSALTQAFGQLLQTLTTEGAERRHYWKSRLSDALGSNAAAVADLIPALGGLLGNLPVLPEMPPAESEQRFHIGFAQFVTALAAPNHPLLLFLDDLQWADISTLRLLEYLVRADGERSVLVVGAYRDNEVGPGDPLQLSIQAIERSHARIEHLQLGPLSDQDVAQLIADTLHSRVEKVAPLTALCLEKTRGNPFFLGQFLRSLYDHGDIQYDREHGAWRWDLAQIRRRGITDNVVTLLLEKLATLPSDTQSLLAMAAQLGGQFDHRQLMAIGDRDAEATGQVLLPALQSGLLVPLNEEYKFAQSPERLRAARYRFLHDRVQQAAHELIPESERRQTQLACGRRLLAASNEAELEERLFVVLGSLNAAIELITDSAERQRLLQLNLHGGKRAKSSSAFSAAAQLYRFAEQLLPEQIWQLQPELALDLYRNLAEAEYLSGHFDLAEQRLKDQIELATDNTSKVTLCLVRSDMLQIQGRFADSFEVLRTALGLLGHDFPAQEAQSMQLFPLEFSDCERLLAERDETALLGLAEMRHPERLLEMQCYYGLAYSTYQVDRGASYVLGACRMVKATLTHGQCDLSCIAYVTYVTAMAASHRPYPACYAMGKLARQLSEQRDNPHFRLSVYQYFAAFYQHWCEPLHATLPYLEQGLAMGRGGVNPLAAGYCALLRSVNSFVMGSPLDDLSLEAEQGLAFLKNSQQPNTETMLRTGVLQPLAALRGKSLHPRSFDTPDVQVANLLNNDFDTPSIALAFHCGAMVRHAYLFDDEDKWQRCSAQLPMIAKLLRDSPTQTESTFFYALGLLKPEFKAGKTADEKQAEADTLLQQFQTWAEHSPDNFHHKALLLAAELARSRADAKAAMELYAQAIDAAAEAGFVHCEALANELYARFWLSQQQRQLASNFIREAYFHYQRWGASAKCKEIEAQWPQTVFRAVELRRTASISSASYRDVSSSAGVLDLNSLLKASRLLSQEVQLDALLQKLLGVVLENAGAEFGAIVMCEQEQLTVEALGRFSDGNLTDYEHCRLPLGKAAVKGEALLPNQVIEFAHLTRTMLVLNKPADDPRFAQCHYLLANRPKSALVLPILSQGKQVAVIYLENNLLEGAFTERHVKTLELLGAQAAISLVNARLIESLEQKVAQRTEELRQMSMKDGLTGIANRRSFDERLSGEWRRCQRNEQSLSLMMIDIDHFKLYNDHYGHVEGDRCIRAVAQTLQKVANRSTDLVARYGGEEFAIILPDTNDEAASWLADAILTAIRDLAIPHAQSQVADHVTISLGLCTVTAESEASPEILTTRADQALYEVKRGGRNGYRRYAN